MVKSDAGNTKILELTRDLRDLMKSGDAPGAVAACQKAVTGKSISVKELYLDCLVPLLTGLGEDWQNHALPVWLEHTGSAIVRDIIGAMAPEIARTATPPNSKTVVLACPSEEQHDIGLRMYADLFRLHGWHTYYLGADVPTAEIIKAAESTGADSIVLSAATHFNLINLNDSVAQIKSALPNVNILVTGPAYKNRTDGSPEAELLDPDGIA